MKQRKIEQLVVDSGNVEENACIHDTERPVNQYEQVPVDVSVVGGITENRYVPMDSGDVAEDEVFGYVEEPLSASPVKSSSQSSQSSMQISSLSAQHFQSSPSAPVSQSSSSSSSPVAPKYFLSPPLPLSSEAQSTTSSSLATKYSQSPPQPVLIRQRTLNEQLRLPIPPPVQIQMGRTKQNSKLEEKKAEIFPAPASSASAVSSSTSQSAAKVVSNISTTELDDDAEFIDQDEMVTTQERGEEKSSYTFYTRPVPEQLGVGKTSEPEQHVFFDDVSLDPRKLRFMKKLGEGGFGAVFKGKYDNRIIVAAKLLKTKKESSVSPQEERESFRWEGERLEALRHSGIVAFYGFCEKTPKRELYIVMEFCEGGSLRDIVRSDSVLFSPRPLNVFARSEETYAVALKGYDLLLMAAKIKPGVLYVKQLDNKLAYSVINPEENQVEGIIEENDLPGRSTFRVEFPSLMHTDKSELISKLKPFLYSILAITSKRGHSFAKGYGKHIGIIPVADIPGAYLFMRHSPRCIYAYNIPAASLAFLPRKSLHVLQEVKEPMLANLLAAKLGLEVEVITQNMAPALTAFVQQGFPSWARIWDFSINTARALAYIHSQGTLHRDLKADNVLLDKDGNAKLADLGLAQADKLLAPKEVKGIAGTKYIPCAAPEELQGHESTSASDMYSYGILLWQMITGKEPYADGKDIKAKILSHKTETIPADCPPEFRSLIEKCWQYEPGKRFTALDAVLYLESIAEKFHPHAEMVRVSQRVDELLHAYRPQYASYIQPYVSANDIDEDWDSFWRRIEEKGAAAKADKHQEDAKEGKDELKQTPELRAQIAQFLDAANPSRLLLILGDGGVGKTLATCINADDLLDKIKRRLRSDIGEWPYLPILIRPALAEWSLSELSNSAQKALHSSIYALDDQTIAKLQQSRVLFIVDGYDEANPDTPRANLAEQLQLSAWPNAKVLVTCRRFVVDRSDEARIFGVDGKYDVCYLLPFHVDQMFSYLGKRLNWDEKEAEKNRQRLQAASQLRSILRIPNMSALVAVSWDTISKQDLRRLTRRKIFQASIQHWIESNKHLLSEAIQKHLQGKVYALWLSYEQYAHSMAYYLFTHKTLCDEAKAMPAYFNGWMHLDQVIEEDARLTYQRAHAASYGDVASEKRSILSEADFVRLMSIRYRKFAKFDPLQKRAGLYSFVHKSWFERSVLEHVISAFNDTAELTATLNGRLLQEEPEIFKFWQEFWQDIGSDLRRELIKKLLNVVMSSRSPHVENAVAASNALSMLNVIRAPFSSTDLRKVHAPCANLEYAVCDSANFTGSHLSNAFMRHIFLRNAQLSNTNLQGINFGERVLHHKAPVTVLSFSQDGKWVATVAESVIYIWNVPQDKLQYKIKGMISGISSVTFSSSGELIAVGGKKAVLVFSINTQVKKSPIILERPTDPIITSLAFIAPYEDLLMIGNDMGNINVLSISTKKQLAQIGGFDSEINFIGFSSDKKKLIVRSKGIKKPAGIFSIDVAITGNVGAQFSVKITDLPINLPKEKVLESILGAGFSTSNSPLVAICADKNFYIADVATRSLITKLEKSVDAITDIEFSLNGRWVAGIGTDKAVYVWDLQSGKQTVKLAGHTADICALKFSPDSTLLATVSGDSTGRIWQLEAGKQLANIEGHTAGISKVRFSVDSTVFATASADNTICLWDVEFGDRLAKFKGHKSEVISLAFSPSLQEDLLISGGTDRVINAWNPKTKKPLASWKSGGWITDLNFFTSGEKVAFSSSDKNVYIMDMKSRQISKKLERHKTWVTSVSVSKSGEYLASGSKDSIVCVWKEQSGTLVRELKGHGAAITSISFSRYSDELLVSASEDKTVRIWQAQSGKQLKKLEGHTDIVSCVCFGPEVKSEESEIIASGSLDKIIKLWGWNKQKGKGESIADIEGHAGAVSSVDFSPNGKLLASASQDATARIWQVTNPRNPICLRIIGTFPSFFKGANLQNAAISETTLKLLTMGGASGERAKDAYDAKEGKVEEKKESLHKDSVSDSSRDRIRTRSLPEVEPADLSSQALPASLSAAASATKVMAALVGQSFFAGSSGSSSSSRPSSSSSSFASSTVEMRK